MSINRIPVYFSDRRRRAIDQLVRRAVTACGVGILLLMLLFFWLIWVILPLFSAPGMQPTLSQQLWDKTPPALNVNRQPDAAVSGSVLLNNAGGLAAGATADPQPAR